MLTFALAALLLLGTASIAATVLFPRRVVAGLLATGLLAFAEVVALSFLLSLAGLLTRGGLVVGLGCGFLAAVVLALRLRPAPWPLRHRLRALRGALRDPLLAVLAVTVLLSLAYTLALGVGTPANDWDSLAYHLPRAALWAQSGTIGYIPGAEDVRLNAFPPNAEVATLFTMVASGSDRFATLPQLAALVVALVGVFGLGRRLGLDVRRALFGSLLFAALPILLLQAGTPLNDVVVVAPLVAATYFALGSTRRELAFAGLAVALAVGTKFTALLVLPLFALVVAAFQPVRRWAWVGLAVACGLAAGSYWYVVNAVETGKLDGGSSSELGQTPPRSAGDILLRIYDLSKDFLVLPATLGRGRYVYPAVGVLLVAAGITAYSLRRRRPAALLVPAGCAVALTPLVFEGFGRLAPHVIEWPLRLVGRRDLLTQAHPPHVLREANPLVTGYGAAGLLLLTAGAAVALAEVRRRRLPRGAVVPALAPALFIPLFATEVRYDDLRSRFFAFTIALAAALWGLLLPRRRLAATVVALTVVTAFTTLAFATFKPSGLELLHGREGSWSVWTASRSRVIAAPTAPLLEDAAVERFVENRVPRDASIGLALRPGEAAYPYFASLSRTVSLIAYGAKPPARVSWLVVSPARVRELAPRLGGDWRVALAVPSGWRVVRRV